MAVIYAFQLSSPLLMFGLLRLFPKYLDSDLNNGECPAQC